MRLLEKIAYNGRKTEGSKVESNDIISWSFAEVVGGMEWIICRRGE